MKNPALCSCMLAVLAVTAPSELFAQAPPAEPAAETPPAPPPPTPAAGTAPAPESAAPQPGSANAPAASALELAPWQAEAASAPPAKPATPITAVVTTTPTARSRAAGGASTEAFDSPSDSPPDGVEARAPETPTIDVWLGMSSTIVTSPGLDPFSENDVVPHFSTGLGWSLGAVGGAKLAAVAVLDLGGSEARNRGERSDLGVVRLGLGPELRLPLLSGLYAYGRINPTAVSVSTELHEASSGAQLTAQKWTVGVDSVLGVALRFADARPQGLAHPIGFFLRFEAGYSWTPELDVRLSSEGSGGPVRTAPLELDELALGGLALRGAFGLGY